MRGRALGVRIGVGVGVGLMTGLAACGPSGPAGPVSTDHVALPPSYLFKPAAIVVAPGTTVTWTNSDRFTHSVRLLDDGGRVMIMRPGDSASFTFTAPGTHRYDCSFHPHDMHATVLVVAAHEAKR